MDESLREALAEEILRLLGKAGEMDPGTLEHQKTIGSIVQLYKVGLEEVQLNDDYLDKENRLRVNEKQAKEQKFDRFIKYGLDVGAIIVPLVFYGSWMKKSFKFEQDGTFTSTTFRGFFNKLKPTKI